MSASPVRTLYGRKGNFLLLPLDVCILQTIDGVDEFRPSPETTRLIAAPIQDEQDGRVGLIAQYSWPPLDGVPVDPVVLVQLAPSANVKGVEDLRVIAHPAEIGDAVVLCIEDNVPGIVTQAIDWCTYPDLTHQVRAYRIEFDRHIGCRAHGAMVRLAGGHLLGMLITTSNQASGTCRGLVYPA